MMKIRKLAVMIMTLCLIMGTMAVSTFAAYDNEMTVSAGNGSFRGSVPENIKSVTPVTGTDGSLTITDKSGSETTVKITPPENHFVSGVRIAGRDEVLTGTQTLGKQDVELVVTYGLRSNMVKYTVNYINAAGGSVPGLPASEEFYGVIGDKPVISYKYADGYLPQTYRLTGTLSDGENVFDFVYYQVDEEGNVIVVNDGTTTAPGGGAGAGAGGAGAGGAGAGTGAGGAGANAADGTNIGDNATPLANGPADIIDIDNNDTPKADADDVEDTEDGKTPLSLPVIIGGGAAILALIAALIAYLVRRNSEYEEDEDDDDAEGDE